MRARTGALLLLIVASQPATAQTVPEEPPCAADDLACQIIRMGPRPGAGGGGGGVKDGLPGDPGGAINLDLGAERMPSEQLRVPEFVPSPDFSGPTRQNIQQF
jgi:hypothetical protein